MWSYLRHRVTTSFIRTRLNDKNTLARNTKTFGELSKAPSNQCVQFANCFNEKDKGRKEHHRKTCDEQREYYPHHDCSLLETVGWVGTALALGLNFRLCNGSRVKATIDKDATCSKPFLCQKISRLIWGLVSALPGKSNTATKLALPNSPKRTQRQTSVSDKETVVESTPLQIEQQRILDSINATKKDLEQISKEYFGQLETIAGLETIDTDGQKGFTHFKEGSRLGNAKAHFNLGVCYESGRGTEIDLEKAAYHFEAASELDHPMALYNLGVYYIEGCGNLPQDEKKGLKLIEKAANLKVPEAKIHMGIHHFEQNQWDLAFPLLKDASSKDPEAQYYLAYCYKNGLGVSQNSKMAEQYFNMASQLGFEQCKDEELDFNQLEETTTPKLNKLRIPNSLHSSSSSPELSPPTKMHDNNKNIHEIAISRYLDIILPVVNFKIGDEFVNDYDFSVENQLDFLSVSDKLDNNLQLSKVNHLMTVH